MSVIPQLTRAKSNQFVALILDNEVTVGEFVTTPALPWARIVQQDGLFQVAHGYPNDLTVAQAKFETKNWDKVSLPGIMDTLSGVGDAVDFVVIGNNAGQGLSLARAVPQSLRANHAAIIYAHSLPEQSIYEQMGYQIFVRRSETAQRLLVFAKATKRQLALYFINTIQHNELNYHEP